ncbi:MAG: gamma-glutamylcyclotransferase family protein [Chitinophagales bacterium]|nr:gamma-glutamylcyclotransferase [Bacteroidota bacterium]
MSEYLFTYGTLRINQNHPMATFLEENAKLVGLALISNAKLYRIDWFPAMISSAIETDQVVGDLFEINENINWKLIDEYEGIGIGEPPYEYKRVKVQVTTETRVIESWAYFYNLPLPADAELIESGDFLNP